jgi:shikimate dehydrogenase
MPLLDSIDDGASLVGAVNTVAMRQGKLVGYNTDMTGFRDSFARGLSGASLRHVLQIGAGGAGAAVAGALLSLGVQRLEIADVRLDRAEALAARLRLRFNDAQLVAIDAAAIDTHAIDGVVNATPIGMIAHPGSPLDASQLRPEMWIVDIVYFPLETRLLRQARNLGCRVLDGSGMVVAQAALAFEIMTGHAADQQRMARSFHRMPSVTTD